jgi:hypothetical protein
MPLMSLADELEYWTDWDAAAFALGHALGLFQDADPLRVKHVFWTDNQLGNGLHDALLALVSAGVLDRREEPDEQFRWVGSS